MAARETKEPLLKIEDLWVSVEGKDILKDSGVGFE